MDSRGDRIIIDAGAWALNVDISEKEPATRRAAWKPPVPKATSGVLGKYVRPAKSASEGYVTD